MLYQGNKQRGFLLIGILLLFSISFISAGEFGYDNPNLPRLENPNAAFGNFTWNGECIEGGVEIRSDGTICAQELDVITINHLNTTYENVTVTDNLIVEGDLNLKDKITFAFLETIDNLVNGWIRITGNLRITGETEMNDDLTILGNLNQTNGNATLNMIYGNLNGHDAGTIVIDSSLVYHNITNISISRNNGFIFNQSGEGELTAQFDGTYRIQSGWSFSGQANTEYHIAVGINWVGNIECHGERKIGTGGDVGSAVTSPCTLEINAGDKINLMIENVDNTANAVISDIGLNILRVGN